MTSFGDQCVYPIYPSANFLLSRAGNACMVYVQGRAGLGVSLHGAGRAVASGLSRVESGVEKACLLLGWSLHLIRKLSLVILICPWCAGFTSTVGHICDNRPLRVCSRVAGL